MPFGRDLHRFDRDVDLVGAHGYGGLVDLDDLAAGFDERLDLLAELDGERERRGFAVGVVLVERPVHRRVAAGEHPLHRLGR